MAKKSVKKLLLITIPSLLVAAAIAAGVYWFAFRETEETKPVVEQNNTIYWNVDGEENFEDGLSTRKLDEDDNTYHIGFVANGREVTLRAIDRKTATKIDSRKVMGLKFDEKHRVVDVVDIEKMTGGIAYYNIYVTEFNERHVKANFSSSGRGHEIEFDIPVASPIYNVSNYTPMLGQMEKSLYPTDKLTVIANKDGSVACVFIVYREPGVDSTHIHCVCTDETKKLAKANGHICEDKRFVPWNEDDGLPLESGYYYLNTDVYTYQNNIGADQEVVLCLNGHTINGVTGRRVYALFNDGAKLTLTDCQKTGLIKPTGNTDQGGAVWARNNTEFTMYAGTIDASTVTTKKHAGAAIALEGKNKMTMYGGKVIGGTVPEGQVGGTVWLQTGSQMDMFGGTLSGGTTVKGSGANVFLQPKTVFNMYGGTITGGYAPKGAGGNIFINKEATFNAYPGTVITSGKAQTGGNIAVTGKGVLNLNGATVKDGVVTAVKNEETGKYSGGHGGNIACAGQININGGVIKNGKSDINGNGGGNMTVYSNDGIANLSGGTIEGGYAPNGGGGNILLFYKQEGGEGPHLNIGNVTIKDGKSDSTGGNITVNDGVVTQTAGNVIGGTVKNDGANIQLIGGKYELKGGTIKDGNTPNANGGNIVIQKNGTFNQFGGTVSGGKAGIGGNIYIYANGHATLAGGTVTGGTVNLKTTVDAKTGESKKSGGHGGNISSSGILTISGAVVNSGVASEGAGGNISFVGKTSEFYMTAGTVQNGNTGSSGGNLAAFSDKIKLEFTGGEIKNGVAKTSGGNVWIGDIASATLSGTTITNGTAPKGGNLYVSGTATVLHTAGVIKNGTATDSGGNLCLSGGTYTLSGGTLKDGYSNNCPGGNVYVSPKCTFIQKDGIVSGGKATVGGNIYIRENGKVEIAGGFVKDGYVVRKQTKNKEGNIEYSGGHGGNISTAGILVISGGTVQNGTMEEKAAGGGNISVVGEFADFTMSGGTVENGRSVCEGGNIKSWSLNPKITFTGGTVKNGVAANYGGNMWVGDKTTVEISGATFTGGSAIRGGSIYFSGKTVGTMYSGTIEGGNTAAAEGNTTSPMGGNLFVTNGTTFNLAGGTIKSGITEKDGGNVRNNGIFNMMGGLITDGTSNGRKDATDSNFQLMGQSATVENSLNMSGGEITGGIVVKRLLIKEDTQFIKISGTAKITGVGLGYDSDLKTKNVFFGKLSEGADVNIIPTVSTVQNAFAFTGEEFVKENTQYIHSKNANYTATAADVGDGLQIFFVEPTDRFMCECGCSDAETCVHKATGHVCKDVLFKQYTATDKLPTSGNYYLANDVTTAGSTLADKGKTLRIDVNGKTVTFNARGFSTYLADKNTNVILCDSVGGGKYISNNAGGATAQGNVFWLVHGKATLYGGTFDGSKITGNMEGTAVCTDAAEENELVLNGAVVIGGKTSKYGGSIYVSKKTKFTMLSGTVKSGISTGRGGNIYFDSPICAEIKGGEILDGQSSYGGNITVAANSELHISGGTVSGGKSTGNAGNIYVTPDGKFTLSGGTVKDGVATTDAGNIRADGKFTMSGGLVTNGSAQGSKTSETANIQMIGQNANTLFTMTGGEITGLISINRLNAPADGLLIKISGDAKITGTGLGLSLASNISETNFVFGDLGDSAQIRLKSNNTGNFAKGKDGFSEDDIQKLIPTDTAKKISYIKSGDVYSLKFVNK